MSAASPPPTYEVMSDARRSPSKRLQLAPLQHDTVMFPAGTVNASHRHQVGEVRAGAVMASGAGGVVRDHDAGPLGGVGIVDAQASSASAVRSDQFGPTSASAYGHEVGPGGSALPEGSLAAARTGGHGAARHRRPDAGRRSLEHGHSGGDETDPYELFKHQIGQKVGFSQFMWRYQQKKQHKLHLREMESYVSADVKAHQESVSTFEKYFFNPDAKEKAKQFEVAKLRRENKSLLKRLFKVSISETPISAANNPAARLRLAKKRNERTRAMREANQNKLNYINSENRLLLHRISTVRGSFDYGKMESDYRRHIKLRDAMRKVDDPVKKKRQAALRKKRRARLRKRRRNVIPKSNGIQRLHGRGLGITGSLPALHRNVRDAGPKIAQEEARRASTEQDVQAIMITLDGRRALVKSWRDAEAFRFQLADPETGAMRMLTLSDDEVDHLSQRWSELRTMTNMDKVGYLTEKLPELLSGEL